MVFANIHAWWTVALLATFIGIVAWAYSSTRKEDFEAASRLPLDDDEDVTITPARRDGDTHG